MQTQFPAGLFRPAFGLLLLAAVLTGCQPRGGSSPGGHSHGGDSHGPHGDHGGHPHDEDEGITFPITVWTNGFEIFAEHEAVVAGEPMQFVTHVTYLESGEPRRAGLVTFRASNAAGGSFDHPQARPDREGIYLPRITFPKSGEWDLTLHIPNRGTNALVPMGRLTVFADAQAARQAAAPAEPEGITFLKEQGWKFPVIVRPATTRELIQRLALPATVQARPGQRAAVTTPLSGRLIAITNVALPDVGARVRNGQVLARVQPIFSELTARLAEARAAAERARIHLADATKTHARIQSLAKLEAKSRRDLQEAETALQLARQQVTAAESLEAAYSSASAGLLRGDANAAPSVDLTSPIDGVVVQVAATAMGEFVSEGTALFHLLNPDPIQLVARLPESRAAAAASLNGADAETSDATRPWLPVWSAGTGRLVTVGLEVDPATRTVPVVLETPNPTNQFRPGQQLTLHLRTGRAADVLAIPVSALIDEDGQQTAYVQVAGETFQKRVVKVGLRDDQWVQVLSGIAPGERVAVQSAYAIRLAALTGGAIPHGHAH